MELNPYVLSMSVILGDPHGPILIEKSDWVGRAICFARDQTKEVEQYGLDTPGIYFLLGDNEGPPNKQRIYVGEAEKISERLQTHRNDDSMDFWTQTIAIVSTSKTLNKADVKYIESELLNGPRNSGEWDFANTKDSKLPSLSGADQIKVNSFLRTMLEILPVLKLTAFELPIVRGLTRYFLSGIHASAEGENQSGGFLVLNGAQARREETPTLSEGSRRLRRRLVEDGILSESGDGYCLTTDFLFSSPSSAACVLLSRSANGRVEWKDGEGQTLKQNQED